jgi:hypothetical protein
MTGPRPYHRIRDRAGVERVQWGVGDGWSIARGNLATADEDFPISYFRDLKQWLWFDRRTTLSN